MGYLLYWSAVTPRDTPSKQTAEFVMAAGTAYLDAVKKKIRSLQEQADNAESIQRLQEELESERAARQSVSLR